MTTRIRYLGIAAYEIEAPVGRVLIDPFLSGSPVAPIHHEQLERPDVILVTHAALDHFGDAAEIARRTGAPVVCSSDSVALLRDRGVPASQIRNTIWGIQVRVGGVHVKPVECHHWAQTRLADGSVAVGWPLAFVVPTEPGISVYHYGDSAISMNMQLIGRLHQPTVGLLGCTQPKSLLPTFNAGAGDVLTGEMSPDEAALAAEFLGRPLCRRDSLCRRRRRRRHRLSGRGAEARFDRQARRRWHFGRARRSSSTATAT